MKSIIDKLNKVFENRIRLGIMSLLMVNESLTFKALKGLLKVSDGNLASHISTLDKHGYISVEKKFVGNKPQTTYFASETGKSAFEEHLTALEEIIKGLH